MQKHPTPQDSWWHERPTRISDLDTGLRPLSSPRDDDRVWIKALMVVGLMFAFGVALITAIGR